MRRRKFRLVVRITPAALEAARAQRVAQGCNYLRLTQNLPDGWVWGVRVVLFCRDLSDQSASWTVSFDSLEPISNGATQGRHASEEAQGWVLDQEVDTLARLGHSVEQTACTKLGLAVSVGPVQEAQAPTDGSHGMLGKRHWVIVETLFSMILRGHGGEGEGGSVARVPTWPRTSLVAGLPGAAPLWWQGVSGAVHGPSQPRAPRG